MANVELLTRICNKYDTLANWKSANPVLKAGEIAIATVTTTGDGSTFQPTVLMKVGDGTTAYNDLPWVAGKAADVYAWAKLENPTIEQLPGNLKTAITALQTAVGDGGSVATKIADAINALDVAAVTAGEGQIIVSVGQTDGKVTVTTRALAAADIPALSIGKITDLQSTLDSKVDDSEFEEFKTTNTAAIAAAKKAGDDAQAAVDALEALVGDTKVSDLIATAKSEAITAAANDATTKANAVDAKLTAEVTRAKEAEAALNTAVAAAQKTADDNTALITAIKDSDTLDSFNDVATAIATAKSDAATDATNKADKALADAKTYADAAETDAVTTANAYTDTEIGKAKTDATNKADKALADAKAYTDETKTDLIGTTGDAATANTIAGAKKYTDEQVAGVTTDLSSLTEQVETLVGEDTSKSVRAIAAEETAKIVAGADTSYDTLKEIADWIRNDTTGAAGMANDIAANTAAIEDIKSDLADGTIVAKEADHADEADHATSADAATKATQDGNGKVIADTYETKTDAASKLAEAKSHAETQATAAQNAVIGASGDAASANTIYGAKADAKAKADTALADAKTYTDGLNAAMDVRMDAVEAKPAMGITSSNITSWNDAVATANSAVQEVTVGDGLKVSTTGTTRKIEIDAETVFVFNCGTASTNI